MPKILDPRAPTTRLRKVEPGKRRSPNNIDNMVVPPFALPPDRNTFQPDDVMSYRARGDSRREDI